MRNIGIHPLLEGNRRWVGVSSSYTLEIKNTNHVRKCTKQLCLLELEKFYQNLNIPLVLKEILFQDLRKTTLLNTFIYGYLPLLYIILASWTVMTGNKVTNRRDPQGIFWEILKSFMSTGPRLRRAPRPPLRLDIKLSQHVLEDFYSNSSKWQKDPIRDPTE